MWQVVGHDAVVERLETAVSSGRLPHALLLAGPEGIGKTTLGLELAKRLNCVGEDPPCQRCVHCRQIAALSHPDVTVIERQQGKDSIAIAQVRELRDAASLRPFQGRRKVYIIAGAEALTAQAADALLKTLEEPPPQVVLVLTVTEPDVLPATIVSRCRVTQLRSVPTERIAAMLGESISPEEAGRIARLARGRVGWSVQAARTPKLVAQGEEELTRLVSALHLNLADRLQLAESLASDRKDRSRVRRALETLLLLLRDAVLLESGMPVQTAPPGQEGALREQAERYGVEGLTARMARVQLAMRRIDANVDARLTLEALLTSL